MPAAAAVVRTAADRAAAALLVGPAGAVLARAARADRGPVALAATASLPLSGLLAYPALAQAAGRGDRRLGLLAGAVVAAHLAAVAPLGPPRRRATGLAGAQLTVLAANLRHDNDRAGALARSVRRHDPDVVVLTEYTPVSAAGLLASGALGGHPWRLDDSTAGGDTAVFARMPIEPEPPVVVGRRRFPRCRLLPAGRSLTLLAVHTTAPWGRDAARAWRAELAALVEAVAGVPGPLLVAGDLNATRTMTDFARLLAAGGLRDVADATGGGWTATFPAGPPWWPPVPLLRPDHVLCRAPLLPVGSAVGRRFGSDHLPVLAGVRWSTG